MDGDEVVVPLDDPHAARTPARATVETVMTRARARIVVLLGVSAT
jgi:hypothetical protein